MTRIKTYVLATVILTFATIGVFALHNSIEDIWTLFFFGIMGFVMRQFGFPLAPMILGVVLGNIAELNLAGPWQLTPTYVILCSALVLFFAHCCDISMIFPIYQKHRDTGSLLERLFSPSSAA